MKKIYIKPEIEVLDYEGSVASGHWYPPGPPSPGPGPYCSGDKPEGEDRKPPYKNKLIFEETDSYYGY